VNNLDWLTQQAANRVNEKKRARLYSCAEEICQLQARNEQLVGALQCLLNVLAVSDRDKAADSQRIMMASLKANKALSNQPLELYRKRQAVIDAAIEIDPHTKLIKGAFKLHEAVTNLKNEMEKVR